MELGDFFVRMRNRIEKEIKSVLAEESAKMLELYILVDFRYYGLRYIYFNDDILSISEKAELPQFGIEFSVLPFEALSFICKQLSNGEYNIIRQLAEGYGRIGMDEKDGHVKFVDYLIGDYVYSSVEFVDITNMIRAKLLNYKVKWDCLSDGGLKTFSFKPKEPFKIAYMMYGILHVCHITEVYTCNVYTNKPDGTIFLTLEGELGCQALTKSFNKSSLLELAKQM